MSFEGVRIEKVKGKDPISPQEAERTFNRVSEEGALREITPEKEDVGGETVYGKIVDGKFKSNLAERDARVESLEAARDKSLEELANMPKVTPDDLGPEVHEVQDSVINYEKAKDAVQSAQNFEELFVALNKLQQQGIKIESTDVPFSAKDWIERIQPLIDKVDRGEPIDPHNDEDFGKITTQAGLLQKVVDLLQIRRQRKALGLDAN